MANVNVTPVNQNPVPIGSIDEALKEGLDPAAYATCAKPNKMTGVLGCPHYDKCRVSAKGTNGPRNYGVQIIMGPAMGGFMVRNQVDCMWLANQVDNIEDNKGSIQVIANEGETFKKVTSILVDNATNEPSVSQYNQNAHREERVVEMTVTPFPRPHQNKELLHDMLRAESANIEKERRSSENLTRNLGLGETVTPLDKRDGSASLGGKAAGRSKP